MALSEGTRLGVYEVVGLIGQGGMGQVWQATDTQLNRQVALKILPDAFAADPDRLARFQREAQILASLNHPNIALPTENPVRVAYIDVIASACASTSHGVRASRSHTCVAQMILIQIPTCRSKPTGRTYAWTRVRFADKWLSSRLLSLFCTSTAGF